MVGFRETLDHSRLERFYDYWQRQIPGNGMLPGRQHIDPIDIPLLMPWVYLTDVEREGDDLRFRHRLVGTRLAERLGREATGRYFDEIYPEPHLAGIVSNCETAVQSGQPHFYRTVLPIPYKDGVDNISYSRLLCPMASDGSSVDLLAGVLVFHDEDEWGAPTRLE